MCRLTLTRIAHAFVLLDFDGHVILTDPWFSEKPGYFHGEPYGVALADLPRLAGVIAHTPTTTTSTWPRSAPTPTRRCPSP